MYLAARRLRNAEVNAPEARKTTLGGQLVQNFAKRYGRLVRFGGVYDFLVTFPFALPGLVGIHLATLERLQGWLGLAGAFPVFHPFHLFFLNLFGGLVVIWSALRIIKPAPLFGLADGIARVAFAGLMLYYLWVWDIPQIVWLFVVPEILFGVTQLGGYWLYRQSQKDDIDCRLARALLRPGPNAV